MARNKIDYRLHFQTEQQITVIFRLTDNSFLESYGVVTSINDNTLHLELIGNQLPEEPGVSDLVDIQITFWSGWALNRCSAKLQSITNGKSICVNLTGPIKEEQRREYFRLDVDAPVTWSIPREQHLDEVEHGWETECQLLAAAPPPAIKVYRDSFRIVNWNGSVEVLPQSINLSGGGVRIKLPVHVEPGTLITLNIFLPLVPPRAIHLVGEVLRCNEITLRWQKGDAFNVALCFHCIAEKDRETIISYIFSEQRRLLQLSQDRIIG